MKVFFILALGALLTAVIGCGDSHSSEGANPVPEVKEDLSSNPDYKAGLALVAQSNCLTCHAVNQTTTGPAYADIAARYAGADAEQINKLAKTIIAGGSGNWGSVPMIPHPEISEEDATKMVKYILLLKK
jgi:cytochrome c